METVFNRKKQMAKAYILGSAALARKVRRLKGVVSTSARSAMMREIASFCSDGVRK